jgi:hypothetical protein
MRGFDRCSTPLAAFFLLKISDDAPITINSKLNAIRNISGTSTLPCGLCNRRVITVG